MEALNKIARAGYLPTKKISELKDGSEFKVVMLKKVSTKYGQKIVANLNAEFEIFLPKRVSDLLVTNTDIFDEVKKNCDDSKLYIKYVNQCIEFVTK